MLFNLDISAGFHILSASDNLISMLLIYDTLIRGSLSKYFQMQDCYEMKQYNYIDAVLFITREFKKHQQTEADVISMFTRFLNKVKKCCMKVLTIYMKHSDTYKLFNFKIQLIDEHVCRF